MTTPVSLATVQVADADFLQSAKNKKLQMRTEFQSITYSVWNSKSKLTQVVSSHKDISTAIRLRLRLSYKAENTDVFI